MTGGLFIAAPAALIGDPARANMLAALMGGQALTAGELAFVAHVAPSTASQHLAKLLDGRLVTAISQGRHRYYKLASEKVARALEGLMLLGDAGPPRHRPRSLRDEALALARTCYDHFAGRLGVALADALVEQGHVVLSDDGGLVTEGGRSFLVRTGIVADAPGGARKLVCRPCLDWSERRWHIGGALGAAIAAQSFEQGWVERCSESRAVTVTSAGKQTFVELFGMTI